MGFKSYCSTSRERDSTPSVNVEYNGQSAEMPLLIVEGSGPSLMGRDWLSQIQLNWKQIHHIHTTSAPYLMASRKGQCKS